MAASDHLSPEQFFHASNARLKPGDLIVPRADRRHPEYVAPDPDADYGFDDLDPHYGGGSMENTSRQTYMSNDPHFASNYGEYVYHVKPTGPYGRDWRDYHEGKSFASESPLVVKGVASRTPRSWRGVSLP